MILCKQCKVREFGPFNTLTNQELEKVHQNKISYTFEKGDVLFEEGNALNGMFCVRSGVCKLMKLSDNGRHQIVKLVSSGDTVGQRSLVSDERTNLKAIALNSVEACFIPKAKILSWLKTNPNLAFGLLRCLAKDLKSADDNIVKMAQKSVAHRLARLLLFIEAQFGVTNDGFLKLKLSRDDYASLIGTTTETTIRTLSYFKKQGLLQVSGTNIKITKPQQLHFLE